MLRLIIGIVGVLGCLAVDAAAGATGADGSNRAAAPAAAEPRPLRVALYVGPGAGGKGPGRIERILSDAGHAVERLQPENVRADGRLSGFDLVIFPGGSAKAQANAIGADGRAQVRRFVEGGGGYLGVCAGAYLGTCGYDWGLKLLDARTTAGKHWRRGTGRVDVELTDAGRAVLGGGDKRMKVYYANGPLLGPGGGNGGEGLAAYEVLAWFRSEVAKNGTPAGAMVDTPAIIAAPLGRGRVILSSPHPESTEGLAWMVENAVNWTAKRPRTAEPEAASEAAPRPAREAAPAK